MGVVYLSTLMCDVEKILPFHGMEIQLVKNNDGYVLIYKGDEIKDLKFYYYYDSFVRNVDISKLNRYDDLGEVLRKVFNSSLLKIDSGESFGGYLLFCEFYLPDGNKNTVKLFTIEVFGDRLEYYSGLEVPRVLGLPHTYGTNNLLGKLDIDNREFTFLYNDSTYLENIPEIKEIGNLIESTIPSQRRKRRKLSQEALKKKAVKKKEDLKNLNATRKRIEKEYKIERITNIKSLDYLREDFYSHIEDGFKDISNFIKLKYPLKTVHFSLIESNHGYYFKKSLKIELGKLVAVDRNDKSTFFHEYGHHIYYALLKTQKMANLVKEVLSEIRKLETIKKIRDKKKEIIEKNKVDTEYIYNVSHYTYLLESTEIFARLFESYMCYKISITKADLNERYCWNFEIHEIELFEKYLRKFELLKD